MAATSTPPAAQESSWPCPVPEAESPDSPIEYRFAARLRRLRHVHNLTQAEMAKSFAIERGAIAAIERGERIPSLVLLEKIANGFGITLSDLLRGL